MIGLGCVEFLFMFVVENGLIFLLENGDCVNEFEVDKGVVIDGGVVKLVLLKVGIGGIWMWRLGVLFIGVFVLIVVVVGNGFGIVLDMVVLIIWGVFGDLDNLLVVLMVGFCLVGELIFMVVEIGVGIVCIFVSCCFLFICVWCLLLRRCWDSDIIFFFGCGVGGGLLNYLFLIDLVCVDVL